MMDVAQADSMTTNITTSDELAALGIPALDAAAVARERAVSVFQHLLTIIALGRDSGMSVERIVEWSLSHAADHGYYDEWCRRHGEGNLVAFLADFVRGRRSIYDDIVIYRLSDGYEVRGHMWFLDDLAEAMFYYGLSADEFCAHVSAMAREHAQRCGLYVEVCHRDDFEIVSIRAKNR
jgi:hypothetical protein